MLEMKNNLCVFVSECSCEKITSPKCGLVRCDFLLAGYFFSQIGFSVFLFMILFVLIFHPVCVFFVLCRERPPSWTGLSCLTHRTSVPARDTSVVSAAEKGSLHTFKIEKLVLLR